MRTHSNPSRSPTVVAALLLVAGLAASRIARAQQPSPMLAQQLATMAQSLAAGQRPVSPMQATFGAHRRGVSFIVSLNAGRCYTFVGAGGAGVVDVDMFLFDPGNQRVALDRRYDPYTQIFYCPPLNGPYRVELKVKRGAGEVAFQTFEAGDTPQSPSPEAPPPMVAPPVQQPPMVAAPPPPPADLLGAQLAALASSAAPGMRQYGAPMGGFSAEGHGQDLYVTLEAGRCYVFVSVSAPTVAHLSTYLWAPFTNKRVATDRSPTNTSRFTHCATLPGAYHFQGKSEEGSGEFRTAIYTAN